MKLVINICFGGFSLSSLAEQAYLKRKGKKAFFYKQTKYSFRDGIDEYAKIQPDTGRSLFYHTVTKDYGDTIKGDFPDDGSYFSCIDIERNDPDLVAVVKLMGKKANGQCAELSIIDIPDGVDYEIDEYDGNESVHEKHRSLR